MPWPTAGCRARKKKQKQKLLLQRIRIVINFPATQLRAISVEKSMLLGYRKLPGQISLYSLGTGVDNNTFFFLESSCGVI